MRRLESYLYFACNTILILIGCVLILFGNQLISGSLIAAGIVGYVMFWVTDIQRRRTEDEMRILDQIDKFGIIDILPRRLTKDEADKLFPESAKSTWDVLGFSLWSFYMDVKDGVLQKAIQRVRLRLLVVHPESPLCTQRDYEESLPIGTTKSQILQLTKFILALNSTHANIRWYKSIPTTSLEIVDNETMAAGPYLIGLRHRNTYTIRIRPGVMFDYYKIHFETLWNDSALSCAPDTQTLTCEG